MSRVIGMVGLSCDTAKALVILNGRTEVGVRRGDHYSIDSKGGNFGLWVFCGTQLCYGQARSL